MNTIQQCRPVEVLLVEDNPADIRLTVEGLREARVLNSLHTVTDGEAALKFLQQRGEYAEAPVPDVILLDLNLPGTDGREVLKAIKQDSKLKVIPVVVLTSSEEEADIIRSYQSHANSYVPKPVDFSSFLGVIRSFESFWLSIVRLPPH